MKKIIVLFLLVLLAVTVLLGGAYSQRQSIVLGKIQKGLEVLSGSGIQMEGAQLKNSGVSRYLTFEIAKLNIKSPAGFNQENLAEISNAEFEVDFLKLLTGKWHLLRVKAPIDRINLEIDSKAKLNLGSLAALQKEALEGASSNFLADQLEFRFGSVHFYDYRSVQNPQPEEYSFAGQMEVYTSVLRPEVLIQAPALKLLYQLNKGSLGLARDKIQDSVARNTGKNKA